MFVADDNGYNISTPQEVMDLVREKGLFSFYEDGHGECCRIRKVRQTTASAGLPLR